MRPVSLLVCGWFLLAPSHAQISSTAYRVLGQKDLRQNGLNMVQGVELNGPTALTLDARGGVNRIYISDAGNARILGWPNVASYQIGDPPAVVLGQPQPTYSNPMGIGPKGLALPYGLAVDPATGNLYVADARNNRILRFPSPFSNPTSVEPDAVIGQPGFTTFGAGVSAGALSRPQSPAFDSAGNLWVADSGNHRVLRFPAQVLDGRTSPQADLVLGQKDFISSQADRGGSVSPSGFNNPTGLAFDPQNTLYVADTNNGRVLRFTSPVNANSQATSVFGQADMVSRLFQPPSGTSMASPGGIAVGQSGTLYVSVPSENRVLTFTPGNGTATAVLGQSDFNSFQPNPASSPLASLSGLRNPGDVKVDAQGNVYVADTGNHRVVQFPPASRSASQVWGQVNFTANGPNQIKPTSINTAFKIAIDYSQAPYALYASDTNNNRVMIWLDSVRFQAGDPADLVIGQPDLWTAVPNVNTGGTQTPSSTSLSAPKGIAVDSSGNLFVADSGNNRVLWYPRPVDQRGRITPGAVLGQLNFTSSTSAGVAASSLRAPAGVAIGPNGDLFVADAGNNRVLEFSGITTGSAAIRVYGQPNFNSSAALGAISSQILNGPGGVFVDAASNLYVADTGNNRVLIFPNTPSAPSTGMPAALVIGQGRFDSGGAGTGNGGLSTPTDVALDSSGNIFVCDRGNNRVVVFPSLLFAPVAGAGATAVVGQKDLAGGAPNWDTPDGLATPESLSAPLGIYLDRNDTLYVGDAGNNRVLQFLRATSVVNAATMQNTAAVVGGSLAFLFSNSICAYPDNASDAPWPDSLANRQIVFNDALVARLYVAMTGQINFQVPSAVPVGLNRVAVRTADTNELLAGGPLPVAAAAPGLFSVSGTGSGQGVIDNQDRTQNSAANPASKGSAITLYGTGQGQVSPPVPDGVAASSAPLSYSITVPAADSKTCLDSQQSMCVVIGSSIGIVQFSGLAPGLVGTWQITVMIPPNASTGNAVPVKVVINGASSNSVAAAIR